MGRICMYKKDISSPFYNTVQYLSEGPQATYSGKLLFFVKLFSICFTYTQHYEYFTTLLNIWVKVGDLKKRQR